MPDTHGAPTVTVRSASTSNSRLCRADSGADVTADENCVFITVIGKRARARAWRWVSIELLTMGMVGVAGSSDGGGRLGNHNAAGGNGCGWMRRRQQYEHGARRGLGTTVAYDGSIKGIPNACVLPVPVPAEPETALSVTCKAKKTHGGQVSCGRPTQRPLW